MDRITRNNVTSLHFMESPDEKEFLLHHSGPIPMSYKQSGILKSDLSVTDYRNILKKLKGNLILVHNTFIDQSDFLHVSSGKSTYFCLCPNSNLYIENTLPPVRLLVENGSNIVIGTDSLASNVKLDIMSELIALQQSFSELSIFDLVRWATINGAHALNDENYGVIESGKKPGLVLLENVDLQNMKITPESTATRLV